MYIPTPCQADWHHMTPNASGRHCATCDKTVLDLTTLPLAARRARVMDLTTAIGNGARVCVRTHIDRDGMLAGSRRVLTGGMAVLLAMTIAGCQGDGPAVPGDQPPPAIGTTPDAQDTTPPAVRGEPALMPARMGLTCIEPPAPTMQGEMADPTPVESRVQP